MITPLKAVIDRFENNQAVLQTDDGQTLLWPKKNLPDSLKEGSAVYLHLTHAATETKKREALAKEILNEIMNAK